MQIQPTKSVPASDLRPGMVAHIEERYILVKHVTLAEDGIKVAGPTVANPEARQRVYDLGPDDKVTIEAPADVREAMVAIISNALATNSTISEGLRVSPHQDGSISIKTKDGWAVELS